MCNAKVVLSTDWWRISYRKELAESKLADKGIECVGATPCVGRMRMCDSVRLLHGRNVTRGVAIDGRLLTDEDGVDFLVDHAA